MARRLLLVAVVAILTAVLPASSLAATAAGAPTLTSAPYVKPATISWTPAADDPLAPLDPNTAQDVFLSPDACPTGAVTTGSSVHTFNDMSVQTYTTDVLADGVYCFHIRTTSLLGGTADGPGLTVAFDTVDPTGTIAIAPAAPGNVVKGTVTISGTSADSVSGVDSSTFRVGAVNACSSGAAIASAWDTTTLPNDTYAVCNVIVDKAGHVAVVATTVTVANPAPPVVPAPAPIQPAGNVPATSTPVTPPVIANAAKDPTAPHAPTKLTVTLPRSKSLTGTVAVRLRWVKPTAADLAFVIGVLNLKRPPRSAGDGARIYKGLGTSASLRLKVGATGYVALFAYDKSGNVSSPARKVVSLAPLIPLRPTSGSSVNTSPRLTWKPQKAAAYYNVQLFRNGTRVLSGWPTQPAYSIPSGKLTPGTYVWFVWPAVKHGTGAPAFGKLIGRATFTYSGR
jgi:hypothetical protein